MSTRIMQGRPEGAASNLTRRDEQGTERLDSYKAATIAFAAPGTITDSANGMAFEPGALLEVRGSALNSGHTRVVTAAPGSLTVAPAGFSTEAAGQAITLRRVL